jgi:hypothetical protein
MYSLQLLLSHTGPPAFCQRHYTTAYKHSIYIKLSIILHYLSVASRRVRLHHNRSNLIEAKKRADICRWEQQTLRKLKGSLSLSLSLTRTHARTHARSSCPRIPCSSISPRNAPSLKTSQTSHYPFLFTHAFTSSFVRPPRLYQRKRCGGYALNILSGRS